MSEIKVPCRQNRDISQSSRRFGQLRQSTRSFTWRTVSPGAAVQAPLPAVGTLPASALGGGSRTKDAAEGAADRTEKAEFSTFAVSTVSPDQPGNDQGPPNRRVVASDLPFHRSTLSPFLRFLIFHAARD